jgi:phosphoribosylanthranilate isomerase
MWIKICANTNLDDAQLATALGADAVGFVFAPSARNVNAADVAKITPHLPSWIERVGVFPALEAEEIARTAQQACLNTIQLHGGVSLDLVRRLHATLKGSTQLIQTVHWNVASDDTADASAAAVANHLREIAADGLVDRVLIDSKVGAATGGTGIAFDWEAARITFAEAGTGLKLIVAGGLREDNVADAIRGLHPWGIDVASGVEQTPGKKSPEKLAAFIRKARKSAQ